MNIQVHIGDKLGNILLDSVMEKIIQKPTDHTYKVFCYPGEGHIVNKKSKSPKPKKQGLLNSLPNLLRL